MITMMTIGDAACRDLIAYVRYIIFYGFYYFKGSRVWKKRGVRKNGGIINIYNKCIHCAHISKIQTQQSYKKCKRLPKWEQE